MNLCRGKNISSVEGMSEITMKKITALLGVVCNLSLRKPVCSHKLRWIGILMGLLAYHGAIARSVNEEALEFGLRSGELGKYVDACRLSYSTYQNAILTFANRAFKGQTEMNARSAPPGLLPPNYPASYTFFPLTTGYNKGLRSPMVKADQLDCARVKEEFEVITTNPSLLLQQIRQDFKRDDYVAEFNAANNRKAVEAFLDRYKDFNPEGLLELARLRLITFDLQEKEQALQLYRQTFKEAVSSQDFASFISAYRLNDPDNLIPIAQERYNKLAKQEQRDEAARQAKLTAWRKGLKVGDDTFCGPVIEIRQPMVRIAIKVPLAGYPSEAWIKVGEMYPDTMAGCRHINGRLEPIF